MPRYSQSSKAKLGTCHEDLITLFTEVIKEFDNTIIYGYRPPELQYELFMKGREMQGSRIVIVDQSKVVTYKDGMSRKSKHNYAPSRAVDAVPYPIDWSDTDRMYYFAGYVMGVAKRLKAEGEITHDIRWGGDWNGDWQTEHERFKDLVHFEIS
jgi:peptidoglycan L-alanyl-D-glutamate endopeptidase CwlK